MAKPKRTKRGPKASGTRRAGPDRDGSDLATSSTPHGDQTNYHPRDGLVPANALDSVDRHLSRATETDESLKRYLQLMRSTTLWVGGLLLACVLIFGAGVGAAVYVAGLSPQTAIGIGAVGSATTLVTVLLRLRRRIHTAVRAWIASDRVDPPSEPENKREIGDSSADGGR